MSSWPDCRAKFWASSDLHRLFQFLGRPECDLLAGLDLDGLAGRRVPSHPCRPLPHLEDAETGQTDFVAPLQMAGGQRHQIAQHGLSLLLRDVMAVGQRGGEVLECDGRLDGSLWLWAAFFAAAFFAGGMTISCGRMTNGWSECRSRSDSLKCTVSPQWPSGRRQPRRGERQHIVPDDQPTLRGRVGTGRLKVRHLPIADLGGLRQIIQGQRTTDPTALVVDHDLQQPSADRFRCLLDLTVSGRSERRWRPCCWICSPMHFF